MRRPDAPAPALRASRGGPCCEALPPRGLPGLAWPRHFRVHEIFCVQEITRAHENSLLRGQERETEARQARGISGQSPRSSKPRGARSGHPPPEGRLPHLPWSGQEPVLRRRSASTWDFMGRKADTLEIRLAVRRSLVCPQRLVEQTDQTLAVAGMGLAGIELHEAVDGGAQGEVGLALVGD